MTIPRDADLSSDARAYIASLTDWNKRESAREYARMDSQSFQSRIGPAVDALDSKMDELLNEVRVLKRKPTIPQRAVAIFAMIGAAAADVAINAFKSGFHRLP